ncbi:DEAD/DEAH box helicase [Salibacterium halotolerans]|uniref:ATP-dependent RNA helicase CshA n=1 Tax=Salibacterium halotolerans TaxID=1884432 RepID=A0A1I5RMA5_9BACI|nr:ATP-dependent RNA helicase DeaD [Salibacterium halotolerans]
MTLFSELQLDSRILQAVHAMGFEESTQIQAEVIPKAKSGKDISGQAQTGTGKTAAFGIPLIEKVTNDEHSPQGLVLTPTRELAVQVSEELNRLGQYIGVKAQAVYGGQDISRQIKALKRRPQIIVATPGRFMDHMRRKTIRPEYMDMIVLDEADEMLSMGFIEDIETILGSVSKERQTLLFSATMPKRLQHVMQKFMKDPEEVKVKSKGMTVSNIDQYYMEVPEKQKFDTLCHLLDITPPDLAIIFGRTKRRVDELSEALNQRGYAAAGIHGDLKQQQRDKVLRQFKNGSIDILVATDVAARGLDVQNVTHVYNFDLPQDPESYVHRIGRTGRAGKEGSAVSFSTPKEIGHLRFIEKTIDKKMKKQDIPTLEEARYGRYQQAVNRLKEAASEDVPDELEQTARTLLEEFDAVTLAAAAIGMNTSEPNQAQVKLTEEAPLRPKQKKGGKPGGKPGGKKRMDRSKRNPRQKNRS